MLALVTNYILGKDMAWDTLNYHFYAGFSALNDRFAQDYFAAGPQSYFNPYSYVPFYVLVKSGLSSLGISSVLAAIHSIMLWLTYDLAVLICRSDQPRFRLGFGLCAVALAYVNPILMQEIGSSFNDITTGELVLAGWLLIALAVCKPTAGRIICAGLLIGAATALKLTNVVHAISALGLLIFLPLAWKGRIRYAFTYGISLLCGLFIAGAPWSLRLENRFGNPLFPLMNGVFRSPEFTTAPLRHFRFIPETLGEALLRPFAMLDPSRMVHEELRAPDLRYAVLVLLIAISLVTLVWRYRGALAGVLSREMNRPAARVLAALALGLFIDWLLWMSGSGNSRYFLPMSSVAAVVSVGLMFGLLATRLKLRNYALAAILGLQGIQLALGAEFRWNPVAWDNHWFLVDIPEQLAAQPNLYITMGAQTNSFIAPFLAPGSGLVNISGGYVLAPEGANGARVAALIDRYSPNVRVLIRGRRLYSEEEHRAPRLSIVNDELVRYGLRTDTSDCANITVHGLPPDLEITLARSTPAEARVTDRTEFVSCRAVHDDNDKDRLALIVAQRTIDQVLDRLEDACPKLFQPSRSGTEYQGDIWRRLYTNTDLTAWVSHGWVKFSDTVRGDPLVTVGRETDWQRGPLKLVCSRHHGHYFATVVNSQDAP
jgi:hypothetical protein